MELFRVPCMRKGTTVDRTRASLLHRMSVLIEFLTKRDFMRKNYLCKFLEPPTSCVIKMDICGDMCKMGHFTLPFLMTGISED
jgi:hypothetical protein